MEINYIVAKSKKITGVGRYEKEIYERLVKKVKLNKIEYNLDQFRFKNKILGGIKAIVLATYLFIPISTLILAFLH